MVGDVCLPLDRYYWSRSVRLLVGSRAIFMNMSIIESETN